MQVRLRVLNGSSAGKDLKISYDEFLVGRSEDCHLRPKSDAISRRHCIIRLRDDKVLVEDLGSRNGTFLNGERLEAETEAHAGDVLRVGKLEFEFEFELEVEQPAHAADAGGAGQEVTDDSWADDDDITRWLQTEEQDGAAARRDPETRQFRLDETERVALETVVKPPAETTAPAEKGANGDSAGSDPDKSDKKKFGKLPPRQAANTGANSREAAADMLKRFFNRP